MIQNLTAKFLSCCFFSLLINATAIGQNVAINTDGSSPNPSALVDMKSDSKGLLIPRMTTQQRNSIASPATGLLVYQTDAPEGFYYNKGSASIPDWISLGATGPQGPAGSTGVIQSHYIDGTPGVPLSVSLLEFVSSTITVTITAGQRVFLVVSRALGGYSPASNLSIYPAYQSIVPGSPIVKLGLGVDGLQVPSNTRVMFSINGVFEGLPAGTYKFGMAGITTSPNWTNNEWGYSSLLIF